MNKYRETQSLSYLISVPHRPYILFSAHVHTSFSVNLEKKKKPRNCALGYQRVNEGRLKHSLKRENFVPNCPGLSRLGGGVMEVTFYESEKNSWDWESAHEYLCFFTVVVVASTKLLALVWDSQPVFLSIWNFVYFSLKEVWIFIPSCKTSHPQQFKEKGLSSKDV